MIDLCNAGIVLVSSASTIAAAENLRLLAANAGIAAVVFPQQPEWGTVTEADLAAQGIPLVTEEQFPATVRSGQVATVAIQIDRLVTLAELQALWRTVLAFTVAHVGINTADSAEAVTVSEQLATLLAQPRQELPGAIFVGDLVEVVKGKFLGAKGHVALNTPRPEVAEAYLRRRGVKFHEDTRATDDQGRLTVIYLAEEIGGFAWHLRANRP